MSPSIKSTYPPLSVPKPELDTQSEVISCLSKLGIKAEPDREKLNLQDLSCQFDLGPIIVVRRASDTDSYNIEPTIHFRLSRALSNFEINKVSLELANLGIYTVEASVQKYPVDREIEMQYGSEAQLLFNNLIENKYPLAEILIEGNTIILKPELGGITNNYSNDDIGEFPFNGPQGVPMIMQVKPSPNLDHLVISFMSTCS